MIHRSAISLVLLLIGMFGLLLITTSNAPAQETINPNADVQVARIYYENDAQVGEIAAQFAVWEVDTKKQFLLTDLTAKQIAGFERQGFTVEIDDELTAGIHNVLANQDQEGGGIPGYPCYRTVEETLATGQAIANLNPDLAQWLDVGDSWEKTQNANDGYDMRVLRLTNFNFGDPDEKPKLFVTSAIHAREYTTAELMTRFAEYLIDGYDVDPDITWILDYHDIHLMLQSNPDGRKKAEAGQLWRKNTNENYCSPTSNSRGADLNRNFPFEWGNHGGSSGNQCSDVYRGSSAASEPEVQAIVNYGELIFDDVRDDPFNAAAPVDAPNVYIDVHSYSELILWPWGFTSQPTGNGTALQTLGRKLAYWNNYEPQQAVELYPTDGTTDDFFYGELGVASYTYELGTTFFQGCSTFENEILPDNLPSLLYAARTARLPYLEAAGPDVIDIELSSATIEPGDVVTVNAIASDTRYGNSNGVEPTQNIAGVRLYVNNPPWEGGSGFPMNAADGNFNSKNENVTITGSANLPVGRHTLYFQAEDVNGNVGATYATFIYVIDPATAPKIEGFVLDAVTGDPIDATVSADGLFSTTTNPATGFYSLTVVDGTYDVTASANGYASDSATVTAVSGSTATQNFDLVAQCIIGRDTVEQGNAGGWQTQSPWAITNEASFSPSNSWTDSPGGNYSSNRNVSLTSRTVNLTGYSDAVLEFAQICDTEAGYDYCRVEVSTNGGGSWDQVAIYDGNSASWEEISIPVPQLDGQANVKVRFRLTSDGFINDDGWYLDNLTLKASGAACSSNQPINLFDGTE